MGYSFMWASLPRSSNCLADSQPQVSHRILCTLVIRLAIWHESHVKQFDEQMLL